jgi:hypothetical protein
MNQPAMTKEQVAEIISKIEFKDWKFLLEPISDRGWLLQVSFMDRDIYTQEMELQKGRKFYISPYMVKGEVVKTAFLAVLQAMEHEVRETFLYEGKRILGPHIAIDALAEVANTREHRA